MNKALIKKYKPEFEHWLNGGKLLQKQINLVVPAEWEEFLEDWDWPIDELVIIINDEYVEFRKALCEGKVIQIWDVIKQHLSDASKDIYDWRDFKSFTRSSPFSSSIDKYRIKPEEPKFKVGDWVIFEDNTKHKITEINKFSYTFNNNFSCGFETHTVLSMKHWKPKQDELVILKNKNDIISIIKYNGETNVHPFIGEITWLHKKD